MVRKGEKMLEAHKEKIRRALTGRTHTPETKKKISEKNKGKTAWNKGISNPDAIKNLGDYAKGKHGADHPNWKGGVIFAGGYIYIYNKKLGKSFGGNYIKRANYNWYKHTEELIKEPYFLHHIDWDKENDNIKNLKKMKRGEHSIYTNIFIPRSKSGKFNKKIK